MIERKRLTERERDACPYRLFVHLSQVSCPQALLLSPPKVSAEGALDLYIHETSLVPSQCPSFSLPSQVDVHVDGALVESLTEAEPDAPFLEAPPTVEDDAPDAGKCAEKTFLL